MSLLITTRVHVLKVSYFIENPKNDIITFYIDHKSMRSHKTYWQDFKENDAFFKDRKWVD